jgi:hypothetical protein
MKTISEIKKGCFREFEHYYGLNNKRIVVCGELDNLCPTCQALLEQATEYEKEREEQKRNIKYLKEVIEDLKVTILSYEDDIEIQSQQFQKMIEKLKESSVVTEIKFNYPFTYNLLIEKIDELLKEVQEGDKE